MTIKLSRFKSPLPFRGQKRNLLRPTLERLSLLQLQGIITPKTEFLDVFGGSGLISHNIKAMFPKNRVIYNDFDNFRERLKHINQTEQIRLKLRKFVENAVYAKLDKETTTAIKDYLLKESEKGVYIDCITISSYLLFSGNYATTLEKLLKLPTYYHCISGFELEAEGYLEGVECDCLDFEAFIQKYKTEHSFLILDPPYINTDKSSYYGLEFNLTQYLKLFRLIQPPYILYCSPKTESLELMQYLGDTQKEPTFKDLEIHTIEVQHNYEKRLQDCLVLKA